MVHVLTMMLSSAELRAICLGKAPRKRKRAARCKDQGSGMDWGERGVSNEEDGPGMVMREFRPNKMLSEYTRRALAWPDEATTPFSPDLDDGARAELLDIVCGDGFELEERYAWAIPDDRALRILEEFSPVIEIGAGRGYWAHLLRERGVDTLAYDMIGEGEEAEEAAGQEEEGRGKTKKKQKRKSGKTQAQRAPAKKSTRFWTEVRRGGAEKLATPEAAGRTLFLCYPDEVSDLGLQCLRRFAGDTIVHVGELVTDGTLSLPQAPWGRTSAEEFQVNLFSKFHCILRAALPSFPTGRDAITVWKRTTTCPVLMPGSGSSDGEDDGDDDEEEDAGPEVHWWRHIPVAERLEVDAAAPCAAHLL